MAEINKDFATAYILETLQYNAKCCGVNGPSDYNTTNANLPGSCCDIKPIHKDKPNDKCGTHTPFSAGCLEKLHFDQIQTLFKSTFGVGVAIIMFELILVFAACCLAREVRYS